MAVVTDKETLVINQVVGQKNDTAIVEEDFVVPDIKPDILNTICSDGTVCIYNKEILDGKVKIDGCINAYIMYLADDEESSIRCLNVTLEFTKVIDFPNVKMGMMLDTKVILKSLECRVLNGRKVSVKAILDMEVKASMNDEVEFVKGVEEIQDIQTLDRSLKINSLLGSGNTKVYAKDTLVIDGIDNLAEIMKVDIGIINQETKISYNKVLAKADACVKIMYRTEDNRICSVSNLIPIMGFVDMPDVSDENICDVKYEIKNVLIKPNNVEEHSIYVEIELEASCNVYQEKEINIIEDLYSPTVDLVYKQKEIKTLSQMQILKDVCSIREKQIISEIDNKKIYDVGIKTNILNQNVLNNRIVYQGEIELQFLFDSGNNRIDSKTIVLPFNFSMDCNGINYSSKIETNINVILQEFTVESDGSIDIKIDLEFCLNMSNNQVINVIEEISIDENRNRERYSLIIYFVKGGDTLWNIAKRFRSTVSNIAEINDIEDVNKIDVGQQLFIPISA